MSARGCHVDRRGDIQQKEGDPLNSGKTEPVCSNLEDYFADKPFNSPASRAAVNQGENEACTDNQGVEQEMESRRRIPGTNDRQSRSQSDGGKHHGNQQGADAELDGSSHGWPHLDRGMTAHSTRSRQA